MEIRSYSHNGANWEWNGDGWPADGETSSALHEAADNGDWSAYAIGERCKIAAFDDDEEELGMMVFTPNKVNENV